MIGVMSQQFSYAVAKSAAGFTATNLQDWRRAGLLRQQLGTPGSGRTRSFSRQDILELALIKQMSLLKAPMQLPPWLKWYAGTFVLEGERASQNVECYLIWTKETGWIHKTASFSSGGKKPKPVTGSDLMLGQPGAIVIDLLAIIARVDAALNTDEDSSRASRK